MPESSKRYPATTFGCRMNEHDSEPMRGLLESVGCRVSVEGGI